jgi:hypothetical protein
MLPCKNVRDETDQPPISMSPRVQTFPLEQANETLLELKSDEVSSSAVVIP